MNLEGYEEKLTSGYYRVRKAWEDEESQIGQYRLLASAVKKADENPGYYVFATNGIAIYPEDEEKTVTDAETTEMTADEAVATVGASGEEGQTNTQPEDENAPEGESEVSSENEPVAEDETASEDTLSDEDIAAAQTERLPEPCHPRGRFDCGDCLGTAGTWG